MTNKKQFTTIDEYIKTCPEDVQSILEKIRQTIRKAAPEAVETMSSGGIMTTRNDYNRQVIEEFRANGGKVGGVWEGTPLLLLTTTGAKSGERRITPMGYIPDGDCLIVIASNGGAPTHPDWYHNLVAHPEVTVEVGTETFDAIAVVTEDSERDRLWTKEVELYPHIAEYQAKITRQIPVIALSRRES